MRFFGLILILITLQACSKNYYGFGSNGISRFDAALAGAYMDKASDFSYSGMSGTNSIRMQSKAKQAEKGITVMPFTAEEHLVGSQQRTDHMNEKRNLFVHLLKAYPIDTKLDNPQLTAYTQASLDCWIIGNSYEISTSFNSSLCKREFLYGLEQLIRITKSHTNFREFSDDVNSIYFKFDRYALTEDSVYRLNHFIRELNKVQGATVMIYGYTDRVGSSKYNKKLSEKRIESVKKYLIRSGVITKNNICIKEIILGEYDPLISPQTINNNPHSRRVDIFVVK